MLAGEQLRDFRGLAALGVRLRLNSPVTRSHVGRCKTGRRSTWRHRRDRTVRRVSLRTRAERASGSDRRLTPRAGGARRLEEGAIFPSKFLPGSEGPKLPRAVRAGRRPARRSRRLAVQKVRDEWTDAGGCLAVPARGVPRASSTPRPCGRQLSAGPLLTSVPGGLPAVNPGRASLQTPDRGPLPSQDEASTLACGARTGRARRTPDSAPAEDHSAGDERGLTARPSPSND